MLNKCGLYEYRNQVQILVNIYQFLFQSKNPFKLNRIVTNTIIRSELQILLNENSVKQR